MNELIELKTISNVISGYSSHVVKSNSKNTSDLQVLLDCVLDVFDVTAEQIRSRKRVTYFTFPRHIFSYIAVNERLGTLKEIGEYIGGKDHTTVIHSHKTAAPSILLDRIVDRKYQEVLETFKDLTYFRNYGKERH